MYKLVTGIVEFRKKLLPQYREKFAKLALGQSPDSLFVACSDSRVVPNLFASTDPGDLFVIRNVGNMIPHSQDSSRSAEVAAIEFSLKFLKVKDIIVCGHSDCGAMHALLNPDSVKGSGHLENWLECGKHSLQQMKLRPEFATEWGEQNRLSQLNVLQQLENLKSYPIVRERIQAGSLHLHAWWFELRHADVYAFDERYEKFVIIDEEEAEKILKELKR